MIASRRRQRVREASLSEVLAWALRRLALHAEGADPGPVPPGVLEWLRRRGLAAEDVDELWRAEHPFAASAAAVMREDVRAAVHAEVDGALAAGQGYDEFAREFRAKMLVRGWLAPEGIRDPRTGELLFAEVPRRLAGVFEANVRVAAAAGQWDRIQASAATHPYLLYQNGPSLEHRPEHVAWAGTLLPIEHEFWRTHFPPNGFNCKCFVRTVSEATLTRLRERGFVGPRGERLPIRETAPTITYVDYRHPATGALLRVPKGIDRGWDFNAGLDRPTARVARGEPPRPEVAIAERRAELVRLGVPEDALARDLDEQPPPPEPTREGMRAWAQRLEPIERKLREGAPMTPHEQQRLRQEVRRLMRAHSPRLFSRDVEHRPERYAFRRVDLSPHDLVGAHSYDGTLLLDGAEAERLGRALGTLASGGSPSERALGALVTVFHEELHGHSPGSGDPNAYQDSQRLEEAADETLARALAARVHAAVRTRRARPSSVALPFVRRSRRGVRLEGVDEDVDDLFLAVHGVTELAGEDLRGHIVGVLEAVHFAPQATSRPLTGPEMLERMARALAPTRADEMRDALERRMLREP